jgi:hypothetical protein
VSHILSRESEFVPSQVTLRTKKAGTETTAEATGTETTAEATGTETTAEATGTETTAEATGTETTAETTGTETTAETTGTVTTPTKEALAKDAATRDVGLRRSRVIEAPGPQLRTLFMPHLRRALVAAFVPTTAPEGPENAENANTEDRRPIELKIEVQLTASGDGDFYGLHSDGGPNRYSHRDVSFVYFLQTEPGCFTGGELRLEARTLEGALRESTEQLIEPEDNRLVMFPSRRRHEILPVFVPSGEFRHSRFTVNGWVSLRALDGSRDSQQDSQQGSQQLSQQGSQRDSQQVQG